MAARPAPPPALLDQLATLLGPRGFTTDQATIAPWLTDWRGRYTGVSVAMLSPADARETAEAVRLCAGAGVAIVPQGGNTSMVAGAIPPTDGSALLLSLRRLNRIRALSPADNVVVAEAGVVLETLHAAAEAAGRRFPLSLGAKGSATIGGLVSTNAGGTQVLRFGSMRALLLGIEAVLPDGSLFEGLSALRKDNRGYDLRQLLAGAEGTLGFITAASLRLVPAAGTRVVAWAGLDRPDHALTLLRLLEERMGEAIESFEIVPAEALALVLEHVEGTRAPLGDAHRWHVLVEATAPSAEADADLRDAVEGALALAVERGLIQDATIAAGKAQADALWKLRESIAEAERKGGASAKHDISIPVSAMPRFLEEARVAIKARFPEVGVVAFGHLGDGNVHFNVTAPPGADDRAWLAANGEAVTAFVHDLVAAEGGSLSAEHGIGQLKRAEFARTEDPVRLAALRAIKAALDPAGIANPGKLLP